MTRKDLIQIIKIRSMWSTGNGDVILPDGRYLHHYIWKLVTDQMKIDRVGILKSGEIAKGYRKWDEKIILQFDLNFKEQTTEQEQNDRIDDLVKEIINTTQVTKGKDIDII